MKNKKFINEPAHLDPKVFDTIKEAIALSPVMSNLMPGLSDALRKSDRIEVQKQKLLQLVGKEKAESTLERIRNEAYSQTGDNGYYIYYELLKLNYEHEIITISN